MIEKAKGGRPRSGEPMKICTIAIPASLADALETHRQKLARECGTWARVTRSDAARSLLAAGVAALETPRPEATS